MTDAPLNSGEQAAATVRDEPGAPGLVVADPWASLRVHTPANIAIGRVGHSLPTREVLRFGLAHAQARDAVQFALDTAALGQSLQSSGWKTLVVHSAADSRQTFLRRPDLGRRLSADSAATVDQAGEALRARPAVCFVIGDGLSAVAVQCHAVPLLDALRVRLEASGLLDNARLQDTPVVIATQARVALADAIAERLRARMVVMLIGERPGLSSPDSLGIYATWAPHARRTDAERNCISNIRAEGLSYSEAAYRLGWLIEEAFKRQLTGVALKDDSERAALKAPAQGPIAG